MLNHDRKLDSIGIEHNVKWWNKRNKMDNHIDERYWRERKKWIKLAFTTLMKFCNEITRGAKKRQHRIVDKTIKQISFDFIIRFYIVFFIKRTEMTIKSRSTSVWFFSCFVCYIETHFKLIKCQRLNFQNKNEVFDFNRFFGPTIPRDAR